MKCLFAFLSLIFIFSPLTLAQTPPETRIVCKDTAIPEGYFVVGETESKDCANQAWIVQKRRTPKMTNDGVLGNLNKVPTQGIESPEGNGAFRVYNSKRRLYFLGVVGAANPNANKFLDSFKLVDR